QALKGGCSDSSEDHRKRAHGVVSSTTLGLRRDICPMNSKAAQNTPPSSGPPFPIVGIGASAGGLEALEQFLTHVPEKCGLAFVVVPHLDPTHEGLLAEILQRTAPMPVVQVTDDAVVEPNHVYVIAPNTDLSILRGVLHALPPT